MKSRSRQLADKSLAAMLAAVEIYNKPAFAHREDSFAILAVSAWESLLKARILQINDNRMAALLEYEHRTTADGTRSGRQYRKRNRAGNHITIGLFKAYDRLVNEEGDKIPSVVRANLEAVAELRDNSVHFMNADHRFVRALSEMAAACVKNYLSAVREWFALDSAAIEFF